MPIRYAGGTIVNTTFTLSGAPTRQEIVTALQTHLTTAGWSVITGGGTSDVVLQSATTPENLAMRVRVYDPGVGNCARVKLRNAAGTVSQTGDMFLQAVGAAGRVYRIIANKYQAFVFVPGDISTARTFACWGALALPTHLNAVITEGLWGQGNGISDTDVVNHRGFRQNLDMQQINQSQWYGLVNGNVFEYNALSSGASVGRPGLAGLMKAGISDISGFRWHDNSAFLYDPILFWGLTAEGDEAKGRGQIWDCVLSTEQYTADLTTTFDGHDWWVMGSNAGQVGAGPNMRGSILVATT